MIAPAGTELDSRGAIATERLARRRELRCAVYSRVSTDEQAVLEYNSLQAQEEICAGYVAMRGRDPGAEATWQVVDTYRDVGYSGGTLERPSLRRLMQDVEAGRIQVVVVYKIDRLSRSISQFYQVWNIFEQKGVDLVSATQDLNTTTSQGKLMLNMLLSFGQFEREQIGERTRDKVAAARKKGRWTGGHPILGYNVDPRGGRLQTNESEAAQVREIFALYARERSLTRVVEKLGRRGWRRKTWTLRSGVVRNGATFDKLGLLHLLRNPLYVGKVPHRGTLHDGQQEAIVDETTWLGVQDLLRRNGTAGYQGPRASSVAILKGLLHCAHCGCGMSPTYTTKGNKRFRYYVCQSVLKRGAHACPTGRVPAHEVEQRVVDQIRAIGRDPALIAETVEQVRRQRDELIVRLEAEGRVLAKELRAKTAALRRAKSKVSRNGADSMHGEFDSRVREIAARLEAIPGEAKAARQITIDEDGIRSALDAFGPIWEELWPTERARILGLLVERIDHDGREKRTAIRFRTDGIGSLAATGAA